MGVRRAFTSRILSFVALSGLVLAVAIVSSRADAASGDTTADNVFGQSGSFVTSGCALNASSLCAPYGVAVDNAKRVYVGDNTYNRVLEYDDPLNTDFIADRVFGQGGSFTSGACNLGGISASSLCAPTDVAVDAAGNVFVADWGNNRVLEYFTPATTDTIADRVFGQANNFTTDTFTGFWYSTTPTADTLTNPISVAIDTAGNLYIGDRGMHRVLQYNPPLSNTTADRVFGQFNSMTSDLPDNGGISPNSLGDIFGIGVDLTGNLYVTDQTAARVLKYNTPTTTDTTADLVFGQLGSFTSSTPNLGGVNADSLDIPTDVTADGAGNVVISDTGGERTLIYDNPPAMGTTADVVFGQGNSMTMFGNNTGGISADSQGDPWALAYDKNCNLYVVDYFNNRVLEYDKPPHACIDFIPTPSPTPVPTAPVLTSGPGGGVTVSLSGGVVVSIDILLTPGSVTMTTGVVGPAPPSGYTVIGAAGQPKYYDITTTATYAGHINVCIPYDASQVTHANRLRLMHYAGGAWQDITTSTDPPHDTICGQATSLSPFAVMESVSPVGGVADLVVSHASSSDNSPDTAATVIVALAVLLASLVATGYARRRRST